MSQMNSLMHGKKAIADAARDGAPKTPKGQKRAAKKAGRKKPVKKPGKK